MPKYVVKNETSFFGEERTVVRQEATGAEVAGAALGLALAARQNAIARDLLRQKNAFDAALAKGEREEAFRIADVLATNGNGRTVRAMGECLKARALRYLGRPEEAVKAATAATQAWEASSDPDAQMGVNYAQCELGWASLMINDAPTAIAAFTRAIKIVPEDQEAFNGRGVALRRIGNYDQSLHDLDRAIQIDPGEKDHYTQRGLTFVEMGNSERALADFTQATRLAPKDPVGFRYLGKMYVSTGDYQKAIEAFSHALSLDARDVEARQARAEIYRMTEDEAKAIADVAVIEKQTSKTKAFQVYRNAADTLYNHGLTEVAEPFEVIEKKQRRNLLFVAAMLLSAIMSYLLSSIVEIAYYVLYISLFVLIIPIFDYLQNRIYNIDKTRKYFGEMKNAETKMPGFTDFYRSYLEARKNAELSKLQQNTLSLFAEGGAAHGFVISAQRDKAA